MAYVIKRYSNRKLYDTQESRYVTLEEIEEMIRAGKEISVVDAATGEDLTSVTLTQIILENERNHRSALPAAFLHQLDITQEDPVAVDAGLDALAGNGVELGDFCEGDASFSSPVDDGLPQRVFRAPFRRCGQPEQFSLLHSFGHHVGHGRSPLGESACFVQDDCLYFVGCLQGFGTTDEDAVLCSFARSDHDGRGRRQTQGTGTGDDEHGHEVQQGVGQGRRRPEKVPDEAGDDGNGDNRRHKVAGYFVHQALDGRFGPLGLLHQLYDLCQHGVPPHFQRLELEGACLVYSDPVDRTPLRLFHWKAFPR